MKKSTSARMCKERLNLILTLNFEKIVQRKCLQYKWLCEVDEEEEKENFSTDKKNYVKRSIFNLFNKFAGQSRRSNFL